MGKCLLGYMKRSGGKNSMNILQGRSQQNLGTGKLEQTSNPLTNKLEGKKERERLTDQNKLSSLSTKGHIWTLFQAN